MYHKFSKDLASKYGMGQAVILDHIAFHGSANGDGWAFIKESTVKQMYPYLNYKTVCKWLKDLEEKGVIQSKKPSSKKGNHTKYYCISQNESSMISQNENSKISQNENSSYITNIEYTNILKVWNEVYGTTLQLTESKKKQIRARLRLFDSHVLIETFTFREKDEWLNSEGIKYKKSWDAFWRSDEKVDKWVQRLNDSKQVKQTVRNRGGII